MGILELLLVMLVAVVVFGPKHLPGAVRQVIYWYHKIKRGFIAAQEELERGFDVGGIKRELYNEKIIKDLEEGKKQEENRENI